MANWKATGPGGVHGYWIKMLASMQERIAFHLQSCITRGEVPGWMTTSQTVLLLKYKSKGNEVSNYRPTTHLPLMWKLLAGIIADEIYNHLEDNYLLPEKQKGCHRNSRGTKDQLLIDKAVMKNCRRRKVGLRMVWTDYQKTYDMVPHLWIKKSMEMCGVADNISHLLSKSMENWQKILMAGNEELARVNIQREIFQRDTLIPLLFVIGLIPLSHILQKVNAGYQLGKGLHKKINHLLFMDDLKLCENSEKEAERLTSTVRIFLKDITMEFGISKCAHVTMKAGKLVSVGGMELLSGEVIPESDKGYK